MGRSAPNVIEGPELGVILDSRYMLMERRPAVAGRPAYLARDVERDLLVEVIVTGEDRIGQPRFRVRSKPGLNRPMARGASAVVERRRRRRTLRDAKRAAARAQKRREDSLVVKLHNDTILDIADIEGAVIHDDPGDDLLAADATQPLPGAASAVDADEADDVTNPRARVLLDEHEERDPAEEAALAAFTALVQLDGNPEREGRCIVFRGRERNTQRPVRVEVKLDE